MLCLKYYIYVHKLSLSLYYTSYYLLLFFKRSKIPTVAIYDIEFSNDLYFLKYFFRIAVG